VIGPTGVVNDILGHPLGQAASVGGSRLAIAS